MEFHDILLYIGRNLKMKELKKALQEVENKIADSYTDSVMKKEALDGRNLKSLQDEKLRLEKEIEEKKMIGLSKALNNIFK